MHEHRDEQQHTPPLQQPPSQQLQQQPQATSKEMEKQTPDASSATPAASASIVGSPIRTAAAPTVPAPAANAHGCASRWMRVQCMMALPGGEVASVGMQWVPAAEPQQEKKEKEQQQEKEEQLQQQQLVPLEALQHQLWLSVLALEPEFVGEITAMLLEAEHDDDETDDGISLWWLPLLQEPNQHLLRAHTKQAMRVLTFARRAEAKRVADVAAAVAQLKMGESPRIRVPALPPNTTASLRKASVTPPARPFEAPPQVEPPCMKLSGAHKQPAQGAPDSNRGRRALQFAAGSSSKQAHQGGAPGC